MSDFDVIYTPRPPIRVCVAPGQAGGGIPEVPDAVGKYVRERLISGAAQWSLDTGGGGGGTNFYQARLKQRNSFSLNDYLQHTLNTSDLYALVHGATQISPVSFSGMSVGDLFFISDYGFDYDPAANTGGPNTTYALCTVISVASDGLSLVYRPSAIFHKYVEGSAALNVVSQEDADYISDTTFNNTTGIDITGLTEDVTINNATFGAPINIFGTSSHSITLKNINAPGISINGPSRASLVNCIGVMVMGTLDQFSASGCMGVDFRANSVVASAQLNYCSNIVVEATASVTISNTSDASIIEVNVFYGGVFRMADGTDLQDNSQFGRIVNRLPPPTGDYAMTSHNGIRQWMAGVRP